MKVIIQSILGLSKALGGKEVELDIPEGSTVASLLIHIIESTGEKVMPYIFDKVAGDIHPHVRIILNERQLKRDEIKQTVLKEGDVISIIPFAAGG